MTIIDLWLSVKRSKKHSDFALLVFTGPLQSGAVSLAFVKEGLDLTYRGLFYGPPRPKSYRLIVGRFDEAWPDFEKQKGAPEGILVPLGDGEAAARALTVLAADQALRQRLGAAANARFNERFTAAAVRQTVRDLYRSLVLSPKRTKP